MIDPITNYPYPDEWVQRCTTPGGLLLVQEGLAVLTSSGLTLRRGFTTGTTAAAACQAAVESADGNEVGSVNVCLACGRTYPVTVVAKDGTASCFKFSGDYPNDVTAGIEFRATLVAFQEQTVLDVGTGIGRWDRDTPRYAKGAPAISGTAMDCILRSIRTACHARGEKGALVHLQAVNGEKVALGTLNGKIGVRGGISILGSTGLVEPWDDHLGQDAVERARAADRAVITTGRVGLRYARLQFPDREVILAGANIRSVLECRSDGLTLFGLPALILKYIDPHILEGREHRTVEELVHSPQGPDALKDSVLRFKLQHPGHSIMIIDRDGRAIEAAT